MGGLGKDLASKPRIVFVCHTAQLGGAELSLIDVILGFEQLKTVILLEDGPLYRRLSAEGVDVRIYNTGTKLKKVKRNSRLSSLLISIPSVLASARFVARSCDSGCIIYANSQKAMIVAAVANILRRTPVVWHLRDILSPHHFNRLMIKVSIAVCNLSVSKVVANSRATAEAFERAGGNKNLVSLVYNGVLSDAFFLAPQLRAPDSLIVGCFARLTPWKGQHILLRSMAYLPGVRVRIVGSALFGEDEYEAELRQIARELGITERVEFLGFREDVPALMKSVDVVAHTSVSPEPFGRVIIEAAYAGRPIVAARGGAVDELLEHGSTGFLVEPNNPAALAEQIDEVWRNWPVAYAVALEAQRQALQRFSVPTMITDLSNLVNSLPGSRRL